MLNLPHYPWLKYRGTVILYLVPTRRSTVNRRRFSIQKRIEI
jgi:hypothetical protein